MTGLNDRTKKVLWSIVECYIDQKSPVSSFQVKKRSSFGLSPATIRNTMADLETSGFITQPHTSAGRIPTDKAFRFYVDRILKQNSRSVNAALLRKLYERLRGMHQDLKLLISETSRTLSFFSSCVGIVTPPRAEEEVLSDIRFIKHEKNRALSIMIFEDGTVKNKMINLNGPFSQKQLTKITRYLNDTFAGMSLKEMREEIMSQLSQQKAACDLLITNALKICEEMIIWESDDILGEGLTGTSNLPDFTDIGQIKHILKTIEDKHMILKLLNEVDDTKGVQVFVGLESIIPSMKKLSMVVSPYAYRRRNSGTIGIIGPTRMNYEQLIPIVDHTARALTKVLSET